MDSKTYAQFCKPGLQGLMSLLKLDVVYTEGRREFLRGADAAGRPLEIIDMLGGYGSAILGHNPPEIRAVLKKALDDEIPFHAQASIRGKAAELGKKLNEMLRAGSKREHPRRYFAHFLSTGAEATEAAVKHGLMQWQARRAHALTALERSFHRSRSPEVGEALERLRDARPVFIALEGSFHGKTAGALAVTHNPDHSDMYASRAARTVYLPRDADAARITTLFDAHRSALGEGPCHSNIAGVFVEFIQGEGGIHPLPEATVQALASLCERDSVPLIADEIQTGLYRTGRFLAAQHHGIDPDYVLLGKGLGGGMAKISALLVRHAYYQEGFGLKHSSTFAEDDFSSIAALKTLELLETDGARIAEDAQRFEETVRGRLQALRERFPTVISAVRGKGFMMGVEFALSEKDLPPISHALDALRCSGFATYVFASYLLHRHGVRVAATLNESNTLRLEPPATVGEESVEKTMAAFEGLAEHLAEGRIHEVTRHLFTDGPITGVSPVLSPPRPYRRGPAEPRRVAFICHLVDEHHAKVLDPMLEALSDEARARFMPAFGPLAQSILAHQQIIEGANGQRILLDIEGIPATSGFFEECLKTGSRAALEKVRKAVAASHERGATHVGLGQYTSIVSDNGLLIPTDGPRVTTGNSLTVGLCLKALKKLVKARGQDFSRMRVGVVGVAGNICNVYTQVIADYVGALTLIHRVPLEKSPKFRAAVKDILWNSRIDKERIKTDCDLAALADCDAVVLGTNSTLPLLMPEHLKKDALVLDISVPSNIHPRVFAERPDVECVLGGYAQLPLGQRLDTPLFPTPDGQIFACTAETVTLGLLDHPESFSLGPLSKEKILRITRMAKDVGIDLGSVKRVRNER